MLDRSHTANLFSENAQEASELAGAADTTVERPAASPDADAEEVQRIASPSATAPPSARPRRPRRAGGGRRGTVPAQPRLAATKPQLSLPSVPPRMRRALAFAPLVLVLVLLILLANQAGCAHQVTRPQIRTSSAPPATHVAAGPHGRPAPKPVVGRSHPATPSVVAPVSSDGGASLTVTVAAQQMASVTATTPATPTAAASPASPPAAPSSGGPSHQESSNADEFGFER
jgi:hypothetical protein